MTGGEKAGEGSETMREAIPLSGSMRGEERFRKAWRGHGDTIFPGLKRQGERRWAGEFETAFPETGPGDAFGAEVEHCFVDDWEDGALASCCGVNLAGIYRGLGLVLRFPKRYREMPLVLRQRIISLTIGKTGL
ncbi:MAG: hypothetical protein WCC27_20480 [Acidobacteriaceae bacterium]